MSAPNFKTYPHINYCTQQRELKIVEYNDFINNSLPLLTQPHKIDYYALIFIQKGELKHKLENSIIELSAGDILFLCPGLLHSFIKNDNVEGYIITFIEEFFTLKHNSELMYENFALLNDFNNIRILKTNQKIHPYINQLLDVINKEFHSNDTNYQSQIFQNIMATIFWYLKRDNITTVKDIDVEDKKYYALALKFRTMIRSNIINQKPLQYYLSELAVSQSTLQKATKFTFNRTPKELIDENTIGAAKGMLADHMKRVSEISDILGFSEPTNFSKYFKKHTGYTPENYRLLY